MLNRADSLRDIATSLPRAIPILEELHLDYCCRGARSLDDACSEAGIDADAVINRLRALDQPEGDRGESLVDLVEHILSKHHRFTRECIATLRPLSSKVLNAHGAKHPELAGTQRSIAALIEDLEPHLLREENVLFPAIVSLEANGASRLPMPISFPLERMTLDHNDVGEILARLRRETNDYTPPEDACTSWRALYAMLAELERDLHMHIHLENNVLFPRALALAQGGSL